jgi:hypothetical protein
MGRLSGWVRAVLAREEVSVALPSRPAGTPVLKAATA